MALSFRKTVLQKLGGKRKSPPDPSPAGSTNATKMDTSASPPPRRIEPLHDGHPPLPTSTATTNKTSLISSDGRYEAAASVANDDLWDLAYERLKSDERKKKLIQKYETIILEGSTADPETASIVPGIQSAEGRAQQMSRVVENRLQAVQDAQLKFTVLSKEIEVRKQFDRAVSAVIWAKGFITQGVSSDPHAALAWAGVCVLLPMLLNPSLQRNAAIAGLDTVSDLICQSRVIDEIYAESAENVDTKTQALRDLIHRFKDKRVELYAQILEFEAQIICYFSTNKVEQIIRDMIKYDSWDRTVEKIQEMGNVTKSDRQIIDEEKMNAGFQSLDSGMQDSLDHLRGISKSIEDKFTMMRERWAVRDRRDILRWLSPLDFNTKQSDTLRRRKSGTGEWLFRDPIFQRWLYGGEKRLWCYGIPGAGKTILASAVIDYIQPRFDNDDIGIAFVYCNYKERDKQTSRALIGSLAKQLVVRHPNVPSSLAALYDNHSQDGEIPTLPTLTECIELLKSQLSCYTTSYLIIDALDECTEETRTELCDHLQHLPGTAHLLVTSRHVLEFKDQINPSAQLEIRSDDNDIEMYLEDRIEQMQMKRLKQHTKADPELLPLIVSTICDKAKGMFLVAVLHMDSLAKSQSPTDVHTALKNLPTSLAATYDEVMERIDSQNDNDPELARNILSWISHARRPLTVAEMQHAVKVKPTTTGIEPGDLIPSEILISVCAGIVTVEEESNIIRLVHYTAQEYFRDKRSDYFPDAEREITNTCLTYLLFDDFRGGYCDNDKALESLLKKNTLLDYTARYWAHHASAASGYNMVTALKFLADVPRGSLSFQVMDLPLYRFNGYSQKPPNSVSGLHLCAYFGMHSLLIRMLGMHSNVNATDRSRQTPLSLAARNGHEAVVKLLLAQESVDVNSTDDSDRTPLSLAAVEGHEAVVRLLLTQESVDVNSRDDFGRTPLSLAAVGGHEAVVKLLLAKQSINVNSKDYSDRTPLSLAAVWGQEAIVRLLLAKESIDVNSRDLVGQTPLLLAAVRGHEAIVRLLLAKESIDVSSRDDSDRTPLSLAAVWGHEAVVGLLLAQESIDVNSRDDFGGTPLSLAARNRHEAVVKLLLAKESIDVNSRKTSGQTLLW